ncbi:sigma 54-interacting transcriptional regulator [Kyrpidia sp.]|uniref:sigma 54-interacting transcriptional regulator n=1 Tax=Kyrpidia sp. TaxID=2073077 RepID=UPI00258E8249|nr:sigma 54-interacting transcriptional regulator [Kyrpidia sp.]
MLKNLVDSQLIQDTFLSLPSAVIVVNVRGELMMANASGSRLYEYLPDYSKSIRLDEICKQRKLILGHPIRVSGTDYLLSAAPLDSKEYHDLIVLVFEEASIAGAIKQQMKEYEATIQDLQTIFENSYDVIYVSDGKGVTLRVSSACEVLWGKRPEELIGRTVYELEKEGVYYPSATRIALERGKKVQIVQQTRTGRRLMVVSTPIRDSSGNIVRVVNASKDITELHELEEQIRNLKEIIEGYRMQFVQLQESQSDTDRALIYRSKKMEDIMALLGRVAVVDSTILITGESGVGKEILANHVHRLSPRADYPLIKINCAAIPESLLESELFGYEKGAFTGAQKNGKAGLFELADKGTLFLDEIGDMPLSVQAKLLRVLQEREITRIGGYNPIPVDVRIIAATNKDLQTMVAKGTFRSDLYYRLNVIPVYIPPLRERREDIVPLVNKFLSHFAQKIHRNNVSLSKKAMSLLEQYDWPGNVRELRNLIERLVVTVEDDIIDADDLPAHISKGVPRPADSPDRNEPIVVREVLPLKQAQKIMETQLLQLAARDTSTLGEIAQKLMVNQSTITRKFQKYGLQFGK